MPGTLPKSEVALKAFIVAELEAARMRTLALLEPLSDDDLERQYSSIMSPLVWDMAHIGYFEELWLLRTLGGERPADARFDDLYDAFRHPRAQRRSLPLLPVADARRYLVNVRGRVLDRLEQLDLAGEDPLLRDGFVYGMVIQHELQHVETMLQTLQLANSSSFPPVEEPVPALSTIKAEEVLVDAGAAVIGTSTEPWAYDNERPQHVVELAPFYIDTHPVTNHDFAEFVADGGYDDERLWVPQGWRMVQRQGLRHPMSWQAAGSHGWARRRFGRDEPLPPREPVQHVSWYEADAFARWAGRRLPSEAEWEAAASFRVGDKQRYPWGDADPDPGRATLAAERFAPAPVGSHSAGTSPWGVRQMIGDVWEWTASSLHGYPGFAAFPYAEYSEVFFGDEYRVLRGGSWATHPLVARTTFRNWDYPERRQLFAGFRCARDATAAGPQRAIHGVRNASVRSSGSSSSIITAAAGFMASAALFAGVEHDLFAALRDGPRDVADMAETCGLGVAETALLVDALVAVGMLERRGHQVDNADDSRRHLAGDPAHNDLRPLVRMWQSAGMAAWSGLGDVAAGARPSIQPISPEQRRVYREGADAFGRAVGIELVRTLQVRGDERILCDQGGSGALIAPLLERYDQMAAAVIADPSVADDVASGLTQLREAGRCHLVPEQEAGDRADLLVISYPSLAGRDHFAFRLQALITANPGARLVVVELDTSTRLGASLALERLIHGYPAAVLSEAQLIEAIRAAGCNVDRTAALALGVLLVEGS